jgi:predicted permease
MVRNLLQDLRFSLRLFRGSPWFTAVAIFTLALGIATNTTVFSWVDSVLLHPFGDAADSDRLAVFESITKGAPNGANQIAYPDYLDYRRNLKSLAGLALHREDVLAIGEGRNSRAVWGELVSANYFDVLGTKPVLGRTFRSEDETDAPGASPVAVISHRLWQNVLRGDPSAIGTTIRVNRRELIVIGVAPADFAGGMPGLFFDVWIPINMGQDLGLLGPASLQSRDNHQFYALARLASGATLSKASAEAAAFSHALEQAWPKTNRGVSATVLPVWRLHSGAPDLLLQPLRILSAIAVLVLLIGCANVANLMLARGAARRREFTIRVALGAGGGRLCRQVMAETLLLSVAAAGVGLLLASWMADLLPGLVPKIGAPVRIGFHLSARILGFTTLACVVATVVSGLLPAWFRLRSDPNETLKEGGRSGRQGGQSHRARNLLVIGEVALATLAVIGAALFVHSFQNARAIDPGFDRDHLVLVRCYPATAGYTRDDLLRFDHQFAERLRDTTAVQDAAYADYAPLGSGAGPYEFVRVEGYAPARDESMSINRYLVSPGYFRTMGIPVLEGREFTAADDAKAAPAVIVNQIFARRYFHGGTALGRTIRFAGRDATVVGVSRDAKYFDIAEPSRPHFYAPYLQFSQSNQNLFFFVRVAAGPSELIGGLPTIAAEVDARAPAFDAMPMAEWTGVTLFPQKVAASMLGSLGAISLLLAAIGLYSVMAYAVTQRTQEIGIRMALGAQPRDVLTDVLLRGAALTLAGLVIGVGASLMAARLVGSMLVGLGAADPATFLGAIVFLSLVALLASYIPARRATRVDPMVALRTE